MLSYPERTVSFFVIETLNIEIDISKTCDYNLYVGNLVIAAR